MKKYRGKIALVTVVIAILLLLFFWNTNAPTQPETDVSIESISGVHHAAEEPPPPTKTPQPVNEELPQSTGPQKTPTPEKTPAIPQPEESGEKDDNIMTCSLTVSCDTVLNNLQFLDESKREIIPKDGKIFENKNAVFYEGESVFNVLTRELKKNKIHIDFIKTPAYNSVYIKGIANLYEFDCGELSGWMYKVNGQIPNRGCSQYLLNNGDIVEFLYSCNLGADIGG